MGGYPASVVVYGAYPLVWLTSWLLTGWLLGCVFVAERLTLLQAPTECRLRLFECFRLVLAVCMKQTASGLSFEGHFETHARCVYVCVACNQNSCSKFHSFVMWNVWLLPLKGCPAMCDFRRQQKEPAVLEYLQQQQGHERSPRQMAFQPFDTQSCCSLQDPQIPNWSRRPGVIPPCPCSHRPQTVSTKLLLCPAACHLQASGITQWPVCTWGVCPVPPPHQQLSTSCCLQLGNPVPAPPLQEGPSTLGIHPARRYHAPAAPMCVALHTQPIVYRLAPLLSHFRL